MNTDDPPGDAAPLDELHLIDDAMLARAHLGLPPAGNTALATWMAETTRWWTPERDQLERLLGELLDDGSGFIHPKLAGLWTDLISMPNPARGLVWINNNPHVPEYLRGLAHGDIPLTHQGLHELTSWRTAAHLRDLLMAAHALPRIDRQILLFERWSHHRLPTISDHEHAQLLRQFTTWHLLPKLHDQATRAPLTPGSRNTAAGRFTTAAAFLAWLAERGHRLHQSTQADVDAWHVERPDPQRLRAFLQWAIAGGHMARLDLPPAPHKDRPPISQNHRLTLLRRFLTEDTIALRTRVAACLLLLYAQPVSRLVRLTINDLIEHDGALVLRLGHPPTPVPEPFAAMLTELAANRANMNTATNPDALWLFPGGRAGQPLTPGALLQQLRAIGVPAAQTRTAAFRQLVLQAPAPVVAHALGYSPKTATKHLTAAGGTWSRYPSTRDG